MSFDSKGALARSHRSTGHYFNSKLEMNATVHKHAEWRKKLAVPR